MNQFEVSNTSLGENSKKAHELSLSLSAMVVAQWIQHR
jgi:hypothetical protein